jgi:coenzyme F420 hydrogenase subunit beta
MTGRSLKTFSDVVDWGLCVGCGACAYIGRNTGVRMLHVESQGFRPVFEGPRNRSAREPLHICPGAHVDGDLQLRGLEKRTEADYEFGPTLEIWEGWAQDPEIRRRGSSGGILTALSLYCLEQAGFSGVVHSGMDPSQPWMNRNYVSRDRAGILARAGSRYAPSAPVAGLADVGDGSYVFIGKPCDASAVSALRASDPELQRKVPLVFTFFCAGTPSTRGTLQLLDDLDVDRSSVSELHYRGDGWPGQFRVTSAASGPPKTLSYEESWGRLTSYRPLRCNLCPDGLGRVADIACGDAWEQHGTAGDPGRSIVLVRTEQGRRILAAACRAGYLVLEPAGAQNVLRAQPNLLGRRQDLFGRLVALGLLGAPTPSYRGFALFRSWMRIGLKRQFRTVAGTMHRAVQRGWFKRRRAGTLEPEVSRG